ncbi:MAG: hypothetical protein AAF624_14560 [Bacteroidota bacterium]
MRSIARVVLTTALLVSVLFWVAACDSTPGASPVDQATPPRVSGLTVTPGTVQFEDVAGGEQTATFALTAAVNLEGEASEVRFVVQPFASFEAAGETVSTPNGSGRIEGTIEVTLPRDQAGILSVLAVAVGPEGGTSEARTTVLVERENNPPSVDLVDGPATFTPPGILRFEVNVSDPDGPNDLLKVEVFTPSEQVFDLFFVREGVYTAGFDVPEAAPGDNLFTFVATDRAGATSAPVEFTVTIE